MVIFLNFPSLCVRNKIKLVNVTGLCNVSKNNTFKINPFSQNSSKNSSSLIFSSIFMSTSVSSSVRIHVANEQ